MNSLFSNLKTDILKGRIFELLFPIVIIASVFVILVPLPHSVMDMMLSANIAISVIILLGTIFISKPLELSIFPTILLATTLFRLVLNVATTKLILTKAESEGTNAAGGVIMTFAEFVAGDQIAVGIIIFGIIVVIQFIVITKGATRVSEVAARFTLDAMPGRQMAIDADLNAGIIDEHEAQKRRQEITAQSDFFGAMDGACKFVRGDAIAGIVITLINVVAGFLIGMFSYGMTLSTSFTTFTKLTIGDGLVSQIPAFLISLATGLLVTRSSQSSNLPQVFLSQLFSKPIVMFFAGIFLFALIPTSLPKIPLLSIGSTCFGLAYIFTKKSKWTQLQEEQKKTQQEEHAAGEKKDDRVEDYLVVDPMELEIGVGLIALADPGRGGDLLDRVHRIRQNVAADIGIILPRVRIRDSFQLDQQQYRIKIAGMTVALGMVYPEMYMAMDSGAVSGTVRGIETLDPAFGTPALWIEEAAKDQAELYGYTVVEPGAVIATHLMEVVTKHADELLTRDATQHLLDELKQASPAVVDELIPGVMKLAQVQQILQLLLREQVPIRQLNTILETLGDYGTRTGDPILLTEFVRARLARTLCTKYRDSEDTLHVVMLDPALEDQVRAGFEQSEHGMFIRFSPQAVEKLCEKIHQETEKLYQRNMPGVVLVNPQIRAALKQMTVSNLPQLVVLSYNEVTRDTKIDSVGMVTM
ncbi:MAG: flagellar biosynthesis protein FlhA [Planctomycetaceae bacterium]|jgi:flagellar biosynthesis protein FlhA|nr:flagellar biosynthesis protein FlhA [Planctomycetaceae bacterium]